MVGVVRRTPGMDGSTAVAGTIKSPGHKPNLHCAPVKPGIGIRDHLRLRKLRGPNISLVLGKCPHADPPLFHATFFAYQPPSTHVGAFYGIYSGSNCKEC